MNPHLADLYQQQGRLLERIATQRQAMAEQWVPVRRAAHGADAVLHWLQRSASYLRSHPLLVATAVTALVILKPRRAWVWGERTLFVWRRWRRLQRWVSLYRLWL
jgi:hypothetical protein